MYVADTSGREVLERRVDGNGVAPSVKTLAFTPLKPGEARLGFNPFPVLPADIAAKAVPVEVELSPSEGKGASVTGSAKAGFRAPTRLDPEADVAVGRQSLGLGRPRSSGPSSALGLQQSGHYRLRLLQQRHALFL